MRTMPCIPPSARERRGSIWTCRCADPARAPDDIVVRPAEVTVEYPDAITRKRKLTMCTKILASLALLGCLMMTGCTNTVAGAGEDISKMGDAITKSTK